MASIPRKELQAKLGAKMIKAYGMETSRRILNSFPEFVFSKDWEGSQDPEAMAVARNGQFRHMLTESLEEFVKKTKIYPPPVRSLEIAAALGAMAQETLLYEQPKPPDSRIIVVDTRAQLKKYFARHPEKMRQMNPHDFEELVADILKDFGYDTQLTKKSRDGGRDIYAYMKTEVSTFLTLVECKRYGARNRVGIDIVQRMLGVCQAETTAHKGMIVTTSFFTSDAVKEHHKKPVEHVLDLVDYDILSGWLQRYKD